MSASPPAPLQAYRKRMQQLLQALHQRLAAQGQGPEGLLGADKPVSYRTKPPASIHRELLGVCSDPYTLAQQLTHVELVSRPGPSSSQTQSREPLRTGHPRPRTSCPRNPGLEPVTTGPAGHLQDARALEQSLAIPTGGPDVLGLPNLDPWAA